MDKETLLEIIEKLNQECDPECNDDNHSGSFPGEVILWNKEFAIVECLCEKCQRFVHFALAEKNGWWSGVIPV